MLKFTFLLFTIIFCFYGLNVFFFFFFLRCFLSFTLSHTDLKHTRVYFQTNQATHSRLDHVWSSGKLLHLLNQEDHQRKPILLWVKQIWQSEPALTQKIGFLKLKYIFTDLLISGVPKKKKTSSFCLLYKPSTACGFGNCVPNVTCYYN